MAKFHDLIDIMRNPPEEGMPESIYDDLTSEYDGLSSSSEAAMAERDTNISSLTDENTALKARNYDLLVSVQTGSEPVVEEEVDEADEIDIPDLFVKAD